MKSMRVVASALACTLLVAASAHAAVVTVDSATLASSAGTYGPLDASGTTLSVTSVLPLTTIGPGGFEGLWFGSTQASGQYDFVFNHAVSYFSVLVNAMSTFSSFSETIGDWTTNAPSTATLTFTNIMFTAWDGATVTSGPQDNGTFLMEVTAAAGQSFTDVGFFHTQVGSANGSVVRQVQYDLFGAAGSTGAPEPAAWALMIGGFFGVGATLRRRASAIAT